MMAIPLKKQLKNISFGFSIILFFIVASCTYNDELVEELQKQQEFVFSLDDLEGYENWTVMGTVELPDVGEFRTVYINKEQEADRTSGAYPVGTIIIKELRDYTNRNRIIGYQVMAKRGGEFNVGSNGWEWGITDTNQFDLLIRGESPMLSSSSPTCYSCHAGHNDLVIKTY